MTGTKGKMLKPCLRAQLSGLACLGLFVALGGGAPAVVAQSPSPSSQVGEVQSGLPQPLAEGIGVDENLDAKLPLELTFHDDTGKLVQLGDYFGKERPVIVSLNYSRCPMLCNVQLTGLVDALRRIPWRPGEEFEIVSVSMDPNEEAIQASKAKEKYVRSYGDMETADGWHFLTGRAQDTAALAKAMGVRYVYDKTTDQFAHPAVFVLASPDGKICRYVYGKEFPPQTLRLSLVEASEGTVGTTIDRVLMFCYHFDPTSGTYSLAAMRLMQVGMGATAVVLAMVLVPFWIRERRRSRIRIAQTGAG